MTNYPIDHIVTKLLTTGGSPYALDVMAEAAAWIENAIKAGYAPNKED